MSTSSDRVHLTVRQRVAAAGRIVIKIGTNVIMRDDGAPAIGLIYGIPLRLTAGQQTAIEGF